MPESLKTKLAECTPEQITQCHGDAEEHLCIEGDKHTRAITGQDGLLTIPESPVLLLFGLAVALSRKKR